MTSDLARLFWGAKRAEMDVRCSAMRELRGRVFIFNLFATWALIFAVSFWYHVALGLVNVFLFAVFAMVFDIDEGWTRLTTWRR